MRLIDGDELLEHVWRDRLDTRERIANLVKFMPTIEPQRMKGRWIPFDIPWYQCSECGAVRENKAFMENFCPNCGSDMRGEQG